MTEFFLHGARDTVYQLTQPTQFRLFYGLGEPCDSFWLLCPWTAGQEELLQGISRFTVRKEGQLIFFGVLDEWNCSLGPEGHTLELHGRGVQALLLDNEAMSADYGVATLSDILRAYVTPYGIALEGEAHLPSVSGFSVKSGSSCWQVLYQFARYHGGVSPHFDPKGRLLLSPLPQGEARVLGEDLPIVTLLLREKRYGMLSQVQVQNRATMAVQTVKNEAFLQEGGSCSRVLTVPRNTGFQTMRYTAQFQLQQSGRGRRRLELLLAMDFVAWPGDLVELKRTDVSGRWRVLERTVSLGPRGYETRLLLGDPEAAL